MRSTFRSVRRALPYVAALAALVAVARRSGAASRPSSVPASPAAPPAPTPDIPARSRSRRRWPLVAGAGLAALAASVALVAWPSGTNASVDWNSGFEQTWAPWQGLQYTGPLASSFQYVTNPVRTGSYSAMFRTEQGYGAYSGEGPNLCCGPTGEGAPGSDHYWALSAYWPSDWVEAYHWGIFFQFHQGNDTSPPIAFEANGNDVTVDIRTGKTNASTGDWAYTNFPRILDTLSKGQWNDFVVHVRWSVTDGQIEVWHRLPGNSFSEVLNLDHIPTLQQSVSDGSIAGVYTLLGFYRDSYCGTTSVTPGCSPNKVQPTQTYYADNFVRGASFDEVVNAAWGSGGAVPTPPPTTPAPAPASAPSSTGSSSSAPVSTTLGNTAGGDAVDSGGADYLDASGPYTVAGTATATKLTGRIAGEASPMKVRGVVYADANGKPGAVVATTNEVTVAAGSAAAWVDLPFSSPVSLTAGGYWLGYWYGAGAGSGGGGFHFTTDNGSESYAAATYSSSGSPPSSFPAGSSSSSRYALYATLDVPAAPVVETPAAPSQEPASAAPAAEPTAPAPTAAPAKVKAKPKAKAKANVRPKVRAKATVKTKHHRAAVHPKKHKAVRPVCQTSVTEPPVQARAREAS